MRIVTAILLRVLPKIISPFQSAFVLGRWIAKNTIVTREVLEGMEKHSGEKGLIGFKMHMSNAYDRME